MNEIERKYKERFLGQIDQNLSECDSMLGKIADMPSSCDSETVNLFRETLDDLRSLLNKSLRDQKLAWAMRLPELERQCRKLRTRLEVELRATGSERTNGFR